MPGSSLFRRRSVHDLIDSAVCEVKCPTCSEPLTVDLSGGGLESGGDQGNEAGEGEANGGRGRGRGRGRRRSKSVGHGVASTAKGKLAKVLSAIDAKKSTKSSTLPGKARSGVTKHSVLNRIDLSKFQSVRRKVCEGELLH